MKNKNILDELLSARVPAEYAAAAVLQQEVIKGLATRLALIKTEPHTAIDMGCATGDVARMLKQRYPHAKIIGVDASTAMLQYAKHHAAQIEWVCAPLVLLPLSEHSADLIVANLALPWCDELEKLLQEWRRILRPGGLLMFTALGPDTLQELHELPLAFPHLIDMHNLGDLLTHVGFNAPVLDIDYFTLKYSDLTKLWHELQVTGMIAGNTEQIQLKKTAENYVLSYEIIFGHAWAPEFRAEHAADETGVVRIPVSHILRR